MIGYIRYIGCAVYFRTLVVSSNLSMNRTLMRAMPAKTMVKENAHLIAYRYDSMTSSLTAGGRSLMTDTDFRTESMISAEPGPVMFWKSWDLSTAWKTPWQVDTPRTPPVVLNRYDTEIMVAESTNKLC